MGWSAGLAFVVGVAATAAALYAWLRVRAAVKAHELWRLLGEVLFPAVLVAGCAAAIGLLVFFGLRAGSHQRLWSEGTAAAVVVLITLLLVLAGGTRYAATDAFDLTLAEKTPVTEAEYATLTADARDKVDGDAGARKVKDGESITIAIAAGRQLTREQYARARAADLTGKIDVTRGSYFHGLYVGTDGRWSTSKVQPLLWTYALLFALFTVLFAGEFGFQSPRFKSFENLEFEPEYLLLLGGPFAAAVLAKGIVVNKVENGDLTKTSADVEDRSPTAGLRDLISDDSGSTDLIDLQYLLFNLVALTYFFVEFVPDLTFPTVPDFLLGLTSAAALTYVTKKAVEKATSQITSVTPSTALPGDQITIRGRYLATAARAPLVRVQGRDAAPVRVTGTGPESELTTCVPAEAQAEDEAAVAVDPGAGVTPATAKLKIVGVTVTDVTPTPVPRTAGKVVVVTGTGFGAAPGEVSVGGVRLDDVVWSDTRITGAIPSGDLPAGAPGLVVVRRHDRTDTNGREASRTVELAP